MISRYLQRGVEGHYRDVLHPELQLPRLQPLEEGVLDQVEDPEGHGEEESAQQVADLELCVSKVRTILYPGYELLPR